MNKENFNRTYILKLLDSVGPMTISEISQRIGLSRPSVYSHLDILEKKGLVRREKNPKKKGAPVTIFPVEKAISEKKKIDLIKFLMRFKDKQSIDIKDLKDSLHDSSYLEASLRGYIDKKVFLSPKGEKFLKENSK